VRNALLNELFLIVAKEVVIVSDLAEGTLYATVQDQFFSDECIRAAICCER
jgi:hypothetical protein